LDKPFTLKEAIREANRCLNCKKPRCQEGCPISNDIPEFNQALGQGNLGEARKIIARKSNLPAVCGRVCAHELQCEGHCVLCNKGEGIRIGELERCIADFAFDAELPLDKVMRKTQGKVAVIGSGPAGLTVAGDLAKAGFDVTVYEALAEPGGILLYGIPSFRLPKKVVRREIQTIETLGVRFVTNCVIG
jgi:glutamate synthase (NADPH/NADH) small chain